MAWLHDVSVFVAQIATLIRIPHLWFMRCSTLHQFQDKQKKIHHDRTICSGSFFTVNYLISQPPFYLSPEINQPAAGEKIGVAHFQCFVFD